VLVDNYVGKKRKNYNGQPGVVVKVRWSGGVDVRFADGVVLKKSLVETDYISSVTPPEEGHTPSVLDAEIP
jgi:hypothetical protein